MEFDYFYGPEDAEQYQFYRIPKLLITSDQFKDVSVEAKLLYGLMLDRLSLSIKNGWFDAMNRAYIIYTIEDVMEDMHCRSQKACKLVAELEKKAGLIKKKRQGLGKPFLIYVLKFSKVRPQNNPKSKSLNFENQNSGDVKIEKQEFRKSPGNKTNQNQTENNKTDPRLGRNASTKPTIEILTKLQENSIKNHDEIFTKLFRYTLCPDIYYVAYQNLYANDGTATKGVNEDTADGFSKDYVTRIIESLKNGTYSPNPVRRTYIKKANGKMRPLGLPPFRINWFRMLSA